FAGSPSRPFPSKAPAALLPPLPLRLLLAGATVARRELHPLKNDTFHGARTSRIVFPRLGVPTRRRATRARKLGLSGGLRGGETISRMSPIAPDGEPSRTRASPP